MYVKILINIIDIVDAIAVDIAMILIRAINQCQETRKL